MGSRRPFWRRQRGNHRTKDVASRDVRDARESAGWWWVGSGCERPCDRSCFGIEDQPHLSRQESRRPGFWLPFCPERPVHEAAGHSPSVDFLPPTEPLQGTTQHSPLVVKIISLTLSEDL